MNTCLQCGVETNNKKFCSRSCSASYNNKGVRRHGNGNIIKCNYCHNLTKNKKFCSFVCSSNYRKQKTIELLVSGDYKAVSSRTAKAFLLNTRGQKCEKCGIETWLDSPINLILNHIDGNSDNWKLENLELICPNCDSYTPTYKAKNIGSGRYYRRQRYKEGRSY